MGATSSTSHVLQKPVRARSSWDRSTARRRGDRHAVGRRQAEYASGRPPLRARVSADGAALRPPEGRVTGEASPVADGVLEIPAAAFAACSASDSGRLVFHSGEPQAPVRSSSATARGRSSAPPGNAGHVPVPVHLSRRAVARRDRPPAGPGRQPRRVALRPGGRIRHPFHHRALRGRRRRVGARREGALLRGEREGPARRVPQERRRHPRGRARLPGAGDAETGERLARREGPAGQLGSGRAERPGRGRPRDRARPAAAQARGATGTARCRRTGGGLLFESDETGRPEIYVTPFPGPGRTFPVSTDGGRNRDWRGTGARSSTPPSTAESSRRRRFPRATPSGSARPRSSSGPCHPSATTRSGACRGTASDS